METVFERLRGWHTENFQLAIVNFELGLRILCLAPNLLGAPSPCRRRLNVRGTDRSMRYANMAGHRLFLLAGCVALGLWAGCATTPARQEQRAEVEQVCATNIDKSQAVQIAEDVLAEMHFALEKADADTGLIRTRPLAAAQFFEFWRTDNVGPFNAALANLHSIRRTAEVRIQQQGDRVFIRCDVQIQKLSLPGHEPAGTTAAPTKRLSLSPEQGKGLTWIDLGKDALLSAEILNHIQKHILARRSFLVSRTSDESQAMSNEK